jgi:hypothetical protein
VPLSQWYGLIQRELSVNVNPTNSSGPDDESTVKWTVPAMFLPKSKVNVELTPEKVVVEPDLVFVKRSSGLVTVPSLA